MKTYKGYDFIYSEDDNGWYAQDFSDIKQSTSEVYPTLDDLKKAIDDNTIKFS
jgi:hypothetical protein